MALEQAGSLQRKGVMYLTLEKVEYMLGKCGVCNVAEALGASSYLTQLLPDQASEPLLSCTWKGPEKVPSAGKGTAVTPVVRCER